MTVATGWIADLDDVADASSFSGVLSISRPGEPLIERAYGWADRRWQIRNQTDTIFALASGTKGFTALAVMSLVLDGTLGLDTMARPLLGADLPEVADDVTVEHLLAHRSGIGDYLDEDELEITDYVLPAPGHTYIGPEDYLRTLEGHPSVFPAGERFAYNNGGYVLLALLAERASGIRYHQLVRDRVIAPAGLADTAFQRSDELQPRTATGYLDAEGLRTNVVHMPVLGVGDGGVFSTSADMRAFWSALSEGRILPVEVVADMFRPRTDDADGSRRYGLGFWLHATDDEVQLEGYDAGISFLTAYRPATGAQLTVISNWSDGAWPMLTFLRSAMG